MTLGIECLLTDDASRAAELAATLDGINRERRDIESGMREQAMLMAESLFDESEEPRPPSACSTRTFTKAWSASSPAASRTSCTAPPLCLPPAARRARSMNSRAQAAPSPAFTCAMRWTVRAKRHPGVILKFGGHAMAQALHRGRRRLRRLRAGLCPGRQNGWTPPPSPARSKPTAPAPEYCRADIVDTLQPRGVGPGLLPPPSAKRCRC